jgi:hypothetical protein
MSKKRTNIRPPIGGVRDNPIRVRSEVSEVKDNLSIIDPSQSKVPQGQSSRHPYFTRFRDLRTFLKTVCNSTLPRRINKTVFKFYRRLYYRTLPMVFHRLRWWKDRNIYLIIEREVFNWLNLASFTLQKDTRINRSWTAYFQHPRICYSL